MPDDRVAALLTARCDAVVTAGRSVVHDTTVIAEDGGTIAMFRGRTVTAIR